jgi:hypothetical protein
MGSVRRYSDAHIGKTPHFSSLLAGRYLEEFPIGKDYELCVGTDVHATASGPSTSRRYR